jgi:hypothetical protein
MTMKRISAIIAAALLTGAIPAGAHAQAGLKAGVTFSDVSNRGVLPGDLSGRTGFTGGLAVSTPWNIIGVGAEGLYAQRGIIGSSEADSRRLDYIDVPVYLRVSIPDLAVRPFLYAGPQFSFELRCRSDDNACPDTDRPETSYAAVVGAGLRFGQRSALSIEGRYLYGLSDLKLNTVTDDNSYRTRAFLILGGIGF